MLLRPIYNDALSVLKRRAGSAAGASVAGIFSCAVVGMVCVQVFFTCCDDCIGEKKSLGTNYVRQGEQCENQNSSMFQNVQW